MSPPVSFSSDPLGREGGVVSCVGGGAFVWVRMILGVEIADRVLKMAVPLIVINTLVIVYELVLG